MRMLPEPWLKYIERDDEGMWKGVREDAPDWAKEGYAKWKAKHDAWRRRPLEDWEKNKK